MLAIVLVAGVWIAPRVPEPTIPGLVASLHKARAVDSYHLLIEAKTTEGQARPYVYQVWKDGERYRTEHLFNFAGDKFARRIACTNGPNVGEFFVAHYDATPNLAQAAKLAPLEHREQNGSLTLRFADLGATEESLLGLTLRGLDWYLDRPEWTKREVVRVRWNGLVAYQIVLAAPDHPSAATLKVTLVPDRGFAAVDAVCEWFDGKSWVNRSRSELEQVGGMWLPTTCTTTQHADGALVSGRVQKVRYLSLNKPLDPKVFTLAEMNLIPGTLVSTPDGIRKWDGKKIVAAPEVIGRSPKPDR